MNNAQRIPIRRKRCTVAELSRQVILLTRQVSRNTEAVNLLSRKFFGEIDERGRVRSPMNVRRIDKAVDEYYALLEEGVKPRMAITEACASVEREFGLGTYKNFTTFRNMVNRKIP